jgi:hypothetical protein
LCPNDFQQKTLELVTRIAESRGIPFTISTYQNGEIALRVELVLNRNVSVWIYDFEINISGIDLDLRYEKPDYDSSDALVRSALSDLQRIIHAA